LKKYLNRTFLSSLLLFVSLLQINISVFAIDGEIPAAPTPAKLVNQLDGLNWLQADEVNALERKLVAYNDSTGTQITIVVLDDLRGFDAGDLAQRIGQSWGVGSKDFSNGLVILIKPTGNSGERKIFLASGYGVEPKLTDGFLGQVRDNILVPYFKKNQPYQGLEEATDEIFARLSGEFRANKKGTSSSLPFILMIVAFIILLIIIRKKGGGGDFEDFDRKGHRYGRINPWLFGALGGFGGGGGSSSWGGGGGGGFGGFGGGSFGGGGAGGSW
jgi:uncharacterized protein